MRKESNIKAKVQDTSITQEDLNNFLYATDKYIDTLEEQNEELNWIVEDQDKTNTKLIGQISILTNDARDFVEDIEALEDDNEELNDLLQEKQDEITEWRRYARELEDKLERQSYLNSFKDKEVVMSDTELMVEKTRRKLCFIQFKDMLKKNPNIKNHVAAEELGVTLETIIKLKCLLAA
jgi:chromosome segregation ATPase